MNRAHRRAAAAAAVLTLAGCGGPAQQPMPTGPLAAAADQRAAHAVVATDPSMNCIAQTFGLQPADAKTIDQVATVYAWVFCQSKTSDTGEVVPAAIAQDGAVRIPSDADLAGDIKRIFPADVRDRATDEPQSMVDLVAGLPSGPPPN
jgi:hypothetical protein